MSNGAPLDGVVGFQQRIACAAADCRHNVRQRCGLPSIIIEPGQQTAEDGAGSLGMTAAAICQSFEPH